VLGEQHGKLLSMTDSPTSTVAMTLADEDATLALGYALAKAIAPPLVIYLAGSLGAGKTTLSRGVLRGLGHTGSVKSPTYTLVEPYASASMAVYHFDLYRLADPEELEYLGIRDYLQRNALLLVEWPERGGQFLPGADLHINLQPLSEHGVDGGRRASLAAQTEAGLGVLARLSCD